jgi:hypothetical protein
MILLKIFKLLNLIVFSRKNKNLDFPRTLYCKDENFKNNQIEKVILRMEI